MKAKDIKLKINLPEKDLKENWVDAGDVFYSIDFKTNETLLEESHLLNEGFKTSYVVGVKPEIILKGRYQKNYKITNFFFDPKTSLGIMDNRKADIMLTINENSYRLNAVVAEAKLLTEEGYNPVECYIRLFVNGKPNALQE